MRLVGLDGFDGRALADCVAGKGLSPISSSMTRLPVAFSRRATASTLKADSMPTFAANSLKLTGMRTLSAEEAKVPRRELFQSDRSR